MQILQSNRLEVLYTYLKAQLFADGVNPLAKRLVIVPSPPMKSWIISRLSQEEGVAMGIEFCTLDQGIEKLKEKHFPRFDEKIPGQPELFFAIQTEILDLFKESASLDLPFLESIKSYLDEKALKDESRLISLSNELAKFFLRYGKFGKGLIREWSLSNKAYKTSEDNNSLFQKTLWQRLKAKYPKWKSEQELLPLLSKKVNSDRKWNGDVQVHLFGLSFISEIELGFFDAFKELYSVSYYMLSPCRFFWSDLLSKWEKRHLISALKNQKQSPESILELEEKLRETNWLLANFGKVGREMARLIEKQEGELLDHCSTFIAPQEDHLTLLQSVQKDLSELTAISERAKVNSCHDHSLEVHAASSPLREVQILYDRLLFYIEESAKKGSELKPNEIVVMAPEIMDYAPYIKAVFGSKESVLDFQILDVALPSQNRYLKALMKLLDLAERRWEAEAALIFLSDPIVLQAQGWKAEDLKLIKEWVKKASIRWGTDKEQRKAAIDDAFWSEGSWEFGFSRLLSGLVMESGSMINGASPIKDLSYSGSELLGDWIGFLKGLSTILKPIEQNQKLALSEWAAYFKNLLKTCFGIDESEKISDEEALLLSPFNTLERIGHELLENHYSYKSIKSFLDKSWSSSKTSYREAGHAVRFCSFLPMRAIPAKVIALCGLHMGAFPRRENESSLNCLTSTSDNDYNPSQFDFDRYLFLEALLSSREHFYMSFTRLGTGEEGERLPSLVIQELLDYLDSGYCIEDHEPSKALFYTHPACSFSSAYFDQKSRFKSYSINAFESAKVVGGIDKEQSHLFIDAFEAPAFDYFTSQMAGEIEIASLQKLAKDPLKFFYEEGLSFKMPSSYDEKSDLEPFELSSYAAKRLVMKSVKEEKSLNELYAINTMDGASPQGVYGKLSQIKLNDQQIQFQKSISNDGEQIKLYTVYFTPMFKEFTLESNGAAFTAPLSISCRHGLFQIVGSLTYAGPNGLVVYGKRSKENLMRSLPEYLIYLVLCKKHGLNWNTRLIFAEEDSPFEAIIDEPQQLLSLYLDYYMIAKKTPSPCYPDWIEPLIEADREDLENKENERMAKILSDAASNTFNTFSSPYRTEFVKGAIERPAFEMHLLWSRFAVDLFEPVQKLIKHKSRES